MATGLHRPQEREKLSQLARTWSQNVLMLREYIDSPSPLPSPHGERG